MNDGWRYALLTAACVAFATLSPTISRAQEAEPHIYDIVEAWLQSAHADQSSEAFTHWNEDGEIPGTCAVCHSGRGLNAYLESDRSTVGRIEHPVLPGATVDCAACHSESASTLQSVPFPSGVEMSNLGASAVCTVCHQGRAWTGSVNAAAEGLEEDGVSADLAFVNSHYAQSAATLFGSAVNGGYEYDGKSYVGPFAHAANLNTCTSCHQPHSLEVAVESCSTCHAGITEFTDIRSSTQDFDGDGDTSAGIAAPIAALHAQLGEAIALYASEIAGAPVIYASDSYPYFFNDTDGDAALDEGEGIFPNRYQSWTPRLLRAAYNYQFVAKDTAAYTHNPHYALQLLYDSLESLSEQVDVDIASLVRP